MDSLYVSTPLPPFPRVATPSLPPPPPSSLACTHPLTLFPAVLAYTVTLLVVALINTSRGAPIWTSSVRLRGSIAPAPASAPSAAYAGAGLPQHQQQPLMQQYQASPAFPQAQAHAQQYPPQPPFAQAPYGSQPPPPAGTPVSATTAASSGPVSLYPQV